MSINHNPYAADVGAMSGDDVALLELAVAVRSCCERTGYGTFGEAAEAFRPRPACPRCRSSRTAKDGRMPAGHRRLGCRRAPFRFPGMKKENPQSYYLRIRDKSCQCT